MYWSQVHALIVKELLSLLRDNKSRMSIIVPPLFQLLVFSFAGTLDVTHADIAILNKDNGKPSFELLQRFHGAPTFKSILYLQNEQEMAEAIDLQKAMMVVHIDSQFSRNLYAKKPANIQLVFDGRKSNTTQVLQGYANTIIERFSSELEQEIGYPQQNTNLVAINWFNPNLLYYWFNVPNLMGILTMLVSMIVTALSVARERELGTFDQLLVSPLNPLQILIGKMVPAIIISIAEATVILLIAIFLFRIPFIGSFALLYVSLLVFSSSIVGVGLFISSISKTQQQAILGSFLFLSPSILLSGYATPIENMPIWLQHIDLINPLRYFLVIVKGLFLKNMPAHIVWMNIWPMMIIALFTFSAADWFFRKKME
jgi:ABC-2 type transport system permease protein